LALCEAGWEFPKEAWPAQITSLNPRRDPDPGLQQDLFALVCHQTWHAFSRTIGWPALHPQAF
jgi:hypothetical protein